MVTITVNPNSKEPVYRQIYDQIIQQLSVGSLHPGDTLPPSRVMAGILDVNFHTVNRSYQLLRDEGIISLSRNRKYVISKGNRSGSGLQEFEKKEQAIIYEALAKGFDESEIMRVIKGILSMYYTGKDRVF